MAAPKLRSVEAYIAAQPDAVQAVVERVRGAVLAAVPDAEELIAYKMPTYRVGGKVFLSLAAWKQHYSLYGATAGVMELFRTELAPYEVVKGSVRFPLSGRVPVRLIEKIARFRAGEVSAMPEGPPGAGQVTGDTRLRYT